MQTVEKVDLDRFMGRWHVLADVPTLFDKKATDPVEDYARNSDGSIATTYSFTVPGNPERRRMNAKGFVVSDSGAIWNMQFVWPIRADYRIVWLADDYSATVIARNKRDYVWIMARERTLPADTYNRLLSFVEEIGYDLDSLRLHQPLAQSVVQSGQRGQ